MWGGDACVAPVPIHPAPSPLPATGSPVAHKGRYFVKRAEKRLRLVGAGEVWMWGGDACVAPYLSTLLHRPCPQRATHWPLVSYPHARFLNEPGGDLAEYSGAQAVHHEILEKQG